MGQAGGGKEDVLRSYEIRAAILAVQTSAAMPGKVTLEKKYGTD